MQIRLVVGIAVAFPDCSPILSRRKIVSDIVHGIIAGGVLASRRSTAGLSCSDVPSSAIEWPTADRLIELVEREGLEPSTPESHRCRPCRPARTYGSYNGSAF
jgi:hypothetical protein